VTAHRVRHPATGTSGRLQCGAVRAIIFIILGSVGIVFTDRKADIDDLHDLAEVKQYLVQVTQLRRMRAIGDMAGAKPRETGLQISEGGQIVARKLDTIGVRPLILKAGVWLDMDEKSGANFRSNANRRNCGPGDLRHMRNATTRYPPNETCAEPGVLSV